MNGRLRAITAKCRLRGATGDLACPCIGSCKIEGAETELLQLRQSLVTLRDRREQFANSPIAARLDSKIAAIEQKIDELTAANKKGE